MAVKFKPLEFGLIDEGRFEAQCNEVLKEVMREMLAFKKNFGVERSKGIKGTVTAKMTMCFDGRGDTDFSIKATVNKSTPARPASVTVATEDTEQDGRPTLWVRASGSSKTEPAQQVLCTQDGRTVDPNTGEVLDKSK